MASDELLDRLDAVWDQMPAPARDAINGWTAGVAEETLSLRALLAEARDLLPTYEDEGGETAGLCEAICIMGADLDRARAALETAERELGALLVGKRWPAIERIKRDTEARIVAWLRERNKDEWSAEVRGRVEWYATHIDRAEHRKGAGDGE